MILTCTWWISALNNSCSTVTAIILHAKMYIINVKGKLNILYVVVVFIICCVFYTFHYSGLVPWYLQVCFIVNCKFVKKKIACVCVSYELLTYSLVSKVMMMRMGLLFMPPTQLLLHMKLYRMVVNSVPTCNTQWRIPLISRCVGIYFEKKNQFGTNQGIFTILMPQTISFIMQTSKPPMLQ